MFGFKPKHKYKYINLFSGIGCWELGLQNLPMENVLSCEIDKFARETFKANFSHLPCLKEEKFYPRDVKELLSSDIPDFDILVASPPCQSFSTAGHRLGLLDKRDDKGNMFFEVLRILKEKKPKAFILENVKGLLSAEKGRSFKIVSDLFKNAGYSFHYKVIRGSDCGIPQVRQRVFMVGFKDETMETSTFEFPEPVPLKFILKDMFKCKECDREIAHTILTSKCRRRYGQSYNWQGYMVDGQEVRISVPEMRILMGIPADFVFPVSFTQAFKQVGNGVIVDCARIIGEQVINYLKNKN